LHADSLVDYDFCVAPSDKMPAPQNGWLEFETEILVNHQLDLIAQLESQLRAVHRTMRHLEKLRGAKHRVGPKLSSRQSSQTLSDLSVDLRALEKQLDIQRRSCEEMQGIIEKMQSRLRELRQLAERMNN
jgi:chaperonin cofactor prefoldin